MNTEERQLLERFLTRLTEARVATKDPEADRLIREAVARQPDAAYLLVQRALLLERALENAKTQLEELRKRPLLSNRGGTFLGNDDPWAQTRQAADRTWDATPAYRPAAPSGVPGFLSNLASTAAGVVAGSFLFQGIESLLHPHRDAWSMPEDRLPETVTINHFHGSDDPTDSGFTDPDAPFLDAGYDLTGDDDNDSGWV
ncbi:MAG TPA: DUF2076 domain-containing protein [Methylococcus sp.]|nr:DUF2076 domain-containing protein [Methylococcus sp.]